MAAVERLLEKERELGAAITFEDIAPEVAGVYPKHHAGWRHGAGAWSCGMVAGLIHDVPTVQELIDPSWPRPMRSSANGWLYRPDQ
jgi:nitronate monooxygenase